MGNGDESLVQTGRRRAFSVATGHPSVETVVDKAKKAAASLWILLHAQNCNSTGKCIHKGCHEAKLLHLHMKICPAKGENVPCSTSFKGCEQSRKLLSHYRRCRMARVKDSGAAEAPVNSCLICSLVARQARNLLERTSPSLRKSLKCVRVPSRSASQPSLLRMPPPPTKNKAVVPFLLSEASVLRLQRDNGCSGPNPTTPCHPTSASSQCWKEPRTSDKPDVQPTSRGASYHEPRQSHGEDPGMNA